MHINQLDILYKSYGRKNSAGVIWGHRGQKGNFHKKCYFAFRFHGMVMGLIHIHQLNTLYKSNCSRNLPGVIWGHRGSKGYFHQKGYNSSMLHSITIRLIHVYTLETIYLCYGVKCQPGVILGHRAGFVSFQRHLLSSYPARLAGQGLVLHQFLSSSSSFFFFFFLSTCQYLRHPRSDYAHTWSK